MILENNSIVLHITPQGGCYVDFHRKDLPLNPINWESADPTPVSYTHLDVYKRQKEG